MDPEIDGEAAALDAVDEVVFPQGPGAVHDRFVEARGEFRNVGPAARLCRGVVKDVLPDVEIGRRLPVRAGQTGEADHQVERLSGLVMAFQLFDQPAAESAGTAGGLSKQHQPRHVLGAGLGLGQEKGEVKC